MKNTLTDRTEAESPQAGSRLLISYYVGVILLSFSSISMAESWSDRTDFAQSYFGVGAELLPAVNLNNGSPEIPARTINRLSWGGLHFWRHVDFEISIPISGTDMQSNGVASSFEAGSSYGFSTNIYPWSLEPNSIRPFFGFGFLSGFSFAAGSSINNAPVYAENIIPLKVGLSKRVGNFIFEAGYQKIPVEKFTYYTS